MEDIEDYDEHAELIEAYKRRSYFESLHYNYAALLTLDKLVNRRAINADELESLLKIIPPQYDDEISSEVRHKLAGVFDFDGIPRPVGRPKNKRLTSRDITTDKVTGEKLEAALREYWKGRKTNNAEMGRVIACLEHDGYIRLADVPIMAAMDYFIRTIKRKVRPWDRNGILRNYKEVCRFYDTVSQKVLNERSKIIALM